MALGVYFIRRQRSKLGLQRNSAEFRAWDVAIVFFIAVQLFLLIMPWYPPTDGATGGDVTFWYATYCVVGLGMCVFYLAGLAIRVI